MDSVVNDPVLVVYFSFRHISHSLQAHKNEKQFHAAKQYRASAVCSYLCVCTRMCVCVCVCVCVCAVCACLPASSECESISLNCLKYTCTPCSQWDQMAWDLDIDLNAESKWPPRVFKTHLRLAHLSPGGKVWSSTHHPSCAHRHVTAARPLTSSHADCILINIPDIPNCFRLSAATLIANISQLF